MKRLVLIAAVLFFAACGSDDTQEQNVGGSTQNVSGSVQKGPFANGTNISIADLDADLSQTGATFSTTITDDTGTFSLDDVKLTTSLARIAADGFYFDEVRGELSDARLAIYTYADTTNATTINVNLLGHLEAARIQYLVTESDMTFTAAQAQAHEDVLGIFGFSADGVGTAESLDISKDGDGNAKLLAMSLILQGNRTVAQLAELLSNIQTDIREDGTLDGTSSQEALVNGISVINLADVRANLEERYADLGQSAVVPDFESQVTYFLDNTSYENTSGIEYPTDGSNINILAADVTEFSGNGGDTYDFRAIVPALTQLSILITLTDGDCASSMWFYEEDSSWDVVDETSSCDDGVSQLFTATTDGDISLSMNFMGTGSATIDYFEFGSDTPTFTKNITWTAE